MRAATSTFLISLANSLPRRASTTAFLCLVVAHFECPDMAPILVRRGRLGPAPSSASDTSLERLVRAYSTVVLVATKPISAYRP